MTTGLLKHTTAAEVCGYRDAALETVGRGIDLIAEGFRLIGEGHATAEKAHGNAPFHHRDRSQDEAFRRLFQTVNPEASAEVYRRWLDAKTWMNLMVLTGMDRLMDKTAKEKLLDDLCGDVPPVTEQAIYDTFEHLRTEAPLIFQRGLARTFTDLDRRFRSHDGFKIGARIILTHLFDGWGSWNYHSRMRDTLIDVERTFLVLDGREGDPGDLARAIQDTRQGGWGARQSVTETEFFRIRCFKNGNAHLWMKRDDLVRKANQILADYYGEVLPDAVDPEATPTDLRSTTGALSKDLAFYPTPDAVTTKVLYDLHITAESKVLEPSAGTGHMVRHLLAKGARVDAIEIHPDRVAALRGMGHARLEVAEANFLTVRPRPVYDFVIMNPPFYGTHWMHHVQHAYEFLAPGGVLVSVLPVTAELGETKKHVAFRKWAAERARWQNLDFEDLPPESFASSGTRINTVLLRLYRGRA